MSGLQHRLLLATARAVRLMLARETTLHWPRWTEADAALAELDAELAAAERRVGQ